MKNRTRTYNATLRITRSQERSPWRRYFLLVPLLFAWFAFSTIMRAVDPPPDGGYANENTAEGDFALFSLSIGSDNVAQRVSERAPRSAGAENDHCRIKVSAGTAAEGFPSHRRAPAKANRSADCRFTESEHTGRSEQSCTAKGGQQSLKLLR